jgi:hypothetical protein
VSGLPLHAAITPEQRCEIGYAMVVFGRCMYAEEDRRAGEVSPFPANQAA